MNVTFNPTQVGNFKSAREANAYADAQKIVNDTDAAMSALEAVDDGPQDYSKVSGDVSLCGRESWVPVNAYTQVTDLSRFQFDPQTQTPQRLHAFTYDGEKSQQLNFESTQDANYYTRNGTYQTSFEAPAARVAVDPKSHAILSYETPEGDWSFAEPLYANW